MESVLTSACVLIMALVHWKRLPESVGIYGFIFCLPLAGGTGKAGLALGQHQK